MMMVGAVVGSVGAMSGCETTSPENSTQVAQAVTTGLQPGDVAITCLWTAGSGTNGDAVEITTLVDLEAGTDLKLTDNESSAAGVFNTGEAANEAFDNFPALSAGQSI